MSNTMTEETTELRKMDAALKFKLTNLLDNDFGWRKLMVKVKVDCDPTKDMKYSYEHVRLIEKASETQRRSCSEIFLEEWGTSGKIRPNLITLKNLLEEAELLRAAKVIANAISKDTTTSHESISDTEDNTNYVNSEICPSTKLYNSVTSINNEKYEDIRIPYAVLFNATDGFSDSHLIGTGGFSKVYKGKLENKIVAIKHICDEKNDTRQYFNEIKTLLQCKHDNLLPLLRISDDEKLCIVYEFMKNGSLQDCIACETRSLILNWKLRIKLGTDVACGLHYLHTAFEKPRIHRDIKTANILLDDAFVAKIGDFGLTRIVDNTKTSEGKGTSAYMAHEAYMCDISTKLDVFSFGIVLFELISGLAPLDKSRTNFDLLSHINENELSIEDLLDERAGDWNKDIVKKMYDLAVHCTKYSKNERPEMYGENGVYESLKQIQFEIDN